MPDGYSCENFQHKYNNFSWEGCYKSPFVKHEAKKKKKRRKKRINENEEVAVMFVIRADLGYLANF